MTCPDIFTPQEAQAYLKLPTARAFDNLRREFKVRGVRVQREWRYSREQLDHLRRCLFGRDQEQDKAGGR